MPNAVNLCLPYGEDKVYFTVPSNNLAAVLTPNYPSTDFYKPMEMIIHALKHPIGCSPLRDIASVGSRVLLLCDDNTRLTPAHLIIPTILDELRIAGVRTNNIKILMALGTHRAMSHEELEQKLGSRVLSKVKVSNHDFRNPGALHDLGITANGIPLKINRSVLDADIIIGIGSIVPHHISGYSGGAKIVQPGICGEDTTAATHLLSVRTSRSMLGIVENKVREEMEAIAEKVGVKYVFNTVLNPNGQLVGAFFGDLRQAFRTGVKSSRKVYGVPVRGRTPIVLASSYPCDLEFWQAHKTLYPCDSLVEDGGTIIIVTPCPEGVSVTHPEVLKIAGQSPDDINEQIDNNTIRDKVAGALALAWAKVRQHAKICLVSEGIGPESAAELGFSHAASVSQALQYAWTRHGKDAQVTVLTHGADTLPLIGDE